MIKLPAQIWVFLGSLLFFLLSLAENFSGPHDSITYLNGIVDGYPLVNQHHLLYHYAAYCWLQCCQFVFPNVKNYYLVEAFSAIWGSCTLAVVYSFFRNRFGFSTLLSVISLLPVAFSYGVWFYSINIEVYAPPLFFILMALYLITKPKINSRDWYLIISFHILAVLFHQINILFAIVILWKLWQQRKSVPWLKWISAYALNGTIFVGGAYFIVGWIVEKQNTIPKWVSWIRGYAGSDTYWHSLSMKTPLNVGYGFSHAFLGGHFVFQVPPVKNMLSNSLSSHSLGDEMFIARSIQPSIAILLSVLTGILVILMGWLTVRFLRNFRTLWSKQKEILLPIVLSFFSYSIFFVFWMPEILEFWILQTVLIWLVLIGTMTTGKTFALKPLPTALTLGILLFCINYFGSIRWMQSKEYDLYYVKTRNLEEIASSKDLLILQDGWILKDFVHYFTKIPSIGAPAKDSSRTQINELVSSTLKNGGKLILLPEIHDAKRVGDTQYLDSLRALYPGRLQQIRKADPETWQIQ